MTVLKKPKLKKPIKIRKAWAINPRTRVKVSKKVYKRQEVKKEAKRILKEYK